MGLSTIFSLQFGKCTYGSSLGTHRASLSRWAREASEGDRRPPGRTWLLPGHRSRLHPSRARQLFISTAGWKHAGAPGTPTSIARFQAQQQPGTFLN